MKDEFGNCKVKVASSDDQDKKKQSSQNTGANTTGGRTSEVTSTKRECRDEGKVIPWIEKNTGRWWSSSAQCYVSAVASPPPPSDPVWQGNTKGAIYSCLIDSAGGMTIGGPGDGAMRNQLFWSATPPDGGPPAAANLPNARTLADQAIARMKMRAPKIGIAPDDAPGSVGLVGMPVWMWVEDAGKRTMGPVTATASSGGHSVTATASVTELTWDMGEGTSVTCTGKGTKYDVSFGVTDSPDCGHRYTQAGEYDVTVTASWEVQWSGLGQSGTIPMELERSTTIRVGEPQAVVT